MEQQNFQRHNESIQTCSEIPKLTKTKFNRYFKYGDTLTTRPSAVITNSQLTIELKTISLDGTIFSCLMLFYCHSWYYCCCYLHHNRCRYLLYLHSFEWKLFWASMNRLVFSSFNLNRNSLWLYSIHYFSFFIQFFHRSTNSHSPQWFSVFRWRNSYYILICFNLKIFWGECIFEMV